MAIKTKAFRIQERSYIGQYRDMYGKSGIRWSGWKTIYTFEAEPEAMAKAQELSGRGLRQIRVLYGAALVFPRS